MKNIKHYQHVFVLVCYALASNSSLAVGTISLDTAITTALQNNPQILAFQASRQALQEQAIAVNTLPDPKLKLGLMNFPTDTWRRDQEPMTQVQIGIQQMFPAGDSLAIKSRRMKYMAEGESAKADNQHRRVRQQVRHAWLDVLYWENAAGVVQQNRTLFKRLVSTTQSQYATGSHRQQDVVRAELELGMLDDRLAKIRTMIDQARARLGRLLGEDMAEVQLEKTLPILPEVVSESELKQNIETHPLLQMQQSMLLASEEGVTLARQSYKPTWMLDLTYGARDGKNNNGTDRADFASAMVVMDIPLFTGNRQDKFLAASQAERQAAVYNREEHRRELIQQYESTYAAWLRLDGRLIHYRDYLVPKAKENASASMQAYQSKHGDFTSLMRAQITELETLLNALRLRVDYLKVQASLLYLAGEK